MAHWEPLLPRHGIRLLVVHGDGERFARRFRETWKRLPLAVRRRLLKHWREKTKELFVVSEYGRPAGLHIELINDESYLKRVDPGDVIAQCDLFGLSLTFEAKTMDAMPEGPAQALIAHELAHVLQCLENTDLKSDGSKLDPVEVDAWVRVVHWGFDLDLYEDWSANNSPPSPDVTALP